jgi:hypothetical protein
MDQAALQDTGINIGKFIGWMVWDSLPWLLLGGMIGLIVAIGLTVLLARRKLLCRHTSGWNLCAKLGYVAILLALPLGVAMLGSIYSIQNKLHAGIDSSVRPMVAAQMPSLRVYLAEQMKQAGSTKVTSIREMIKPFKQHFSYVPTSSGRWERYKAYWVNEVMVEPAFGVIADTIEDKLLEKLNQAGASVAGDSERARQILSLGTAVMVKQNVSDPADAQRFDREITEVVMTNMLAQLKKAFSPLYMSIWLPMLGIGLLILVEIMVYRRFYWPGRAAARAAHG